MTTISFAEAKTHLSELLDEVALGKKVLITRQGKPAALLTAPPEKSEMDVKQLVKEMLHLRDTEGPTLGGKATIRDLIEAGRR